MQIIEFTRELDKLIRNTGNIGKACGARYLLCIRGQHDAALGGETLIAKRWCRKIPKDTYHTDIVIDFGDNKHAKQQVELAGKIISDARARELEEQLAKVREAISQGLAYLHTFRGIRKVTGYNPQSGWAVTNNTGDRMDQSSFMVSVDQILIGEVANA